MPVRRLVALSLAALTALVAAACSPHHGAPAPAGALVVGVQSDDLGAAIARVHMVGTIDGAPAFDQTVNLPAPGALPKEIPLAGAPGAKVDVQVDAFAPNGTVPIISRLASAHLVDTSAGKKLLRVQLQAQCAVFSPGGAPSACAAPRTCIAAQCVPPDVPDDQLEDYDPAWAAAPPDICRPAKHGPPEVVVGTGQTDYAPLADDQTVAMELGPQGGHHVWIAIRMRNLRQSGSTTTITGQVVGDPNGALPPAGFVFTFDQDEGNYCKLYGLRYQLDSGAADLATDYKRYLGKKVQITVTVTDSTKASASATKEIQLADKLICPDGTDSCNTP